MPVALLNVPYLLFRGRTGDRAAWVGRLFTRRIGALHRRLLPGAFGLLEPRPHGIQIEKVGNLLLIIGLIPIRR